MFHASRDVYPRRTSYHKDVVEFVPAWVKFRAEREEAKAARNAELKYVPSTAPPDLSLTIVLDIPESYDPRYKCNVHVKTASDETLRKECERGRVPMEAATQYKKCLSFYEDYAQKTNFERLVQMAKDKANLPIAAEHDAIVDAVRNHGVTLIAGDTGCGKSTQVPQYLLRAGFSKLAMTQPRRISAIALARRVSRETLNEHGAEIAYKIRFDSTSEGRVTKALFLTEGVLLRQLASDGDLRKFDVVVVDEAHERHCNTDLLLGLLRGVLDRRPHDFRIVIMSATMNLELFASYFGGCPVIRVPGRLHPIQTHWIPSAPAALAGRGRDAIDDAPALVGGEKPPRVQPRGRQDRIDPQPYLLLLQRIDANYPRNERGDLLVFLSGVAEIAAVAERLKPYAAESRRWVILPLHGGLSASEQDLVFDGAPHGARKCVLATNVAETSITIDGIRFVCDSGRHKEMTRDNAGGGGVSALREGWISKASAEQRKGRAGRTGPGVCFLMYGENEFQKFKASTPPEIRRASLESLTLTLKQIAGDACDSRTFPWIEPPPNDALEAAVWNLREHGALRRVLLPRAGPRATAFVFTLVPIRPRSRGARRSLRTSPVVCISPPAPRFQSRRAATPFDSD